MNHKVNDLLKQIEQLAAELEQARARETYYRDIAAKNGRKRLHETRELSKLVSQYKETQRQLAQHKNELELLVAERTKEVEQTNKQLSKTLRKQRRTADTLRLRLELDQIILDISSEFINLSVEETDAAISAALAKIASALEIPRCSVFMLTDQNDSVLQTHEYIDDNEKQSQDEEFHDQFFGIYNEILHKHKDIVLRQPADLRRLLPKARDFDDDNFRAFIAVPMMQSGMIYGALALYGPIGVKKKWPSEFAAFLKIIGGVFVNALERKMSELALRESEEDYREIVDKAGLAIFIDAGDGSFHYFNQRFEQLFGYGRRELERFTLLDLVYEPDRKRVKSYHQKRFQNQKAPTHFEFRGRRKDGSIIHLDADIVELRSDGKLMATRGYLWDVTSRVEAERAILESEERYRNLVENFIDIVCIVNLNGDVLYANPAFERITGYSVKEINIKRLIDTLVYVDDFAKSEKIVSDFITSDAPYSDRFECRMVTKNNDLRYTSTIVTKINYMNQQALQIIAHDITEQKVAEKSLRKSAAFEHTVSEITAQFVGKEINDESIERSLKVMGVWSEASRVSLYRIYDDELCFFCSHTWCAEGVPSHLKETRELPETNRQWWIEKCKSEELLHVADVEELPSTLKIEKKVLRSLEIKALIFLPFKVRGRIFGALSFEDVAVTGPWSDEDILLLHIASEILSNALERMEAERMLVKSEEQYRTLFESNNDGIYLFGFDDEQNPTTLLNVNQTACHRLGYSREEMLRMNIFDLEKPGKNSQLVQLTRQLVSQKSVLLETEFQSKQGDVYPVEIKLHLIELDGLPRVMAIERDISERKRIEEEEEKSQRLESIGLLAGGIAHDFNNLLSIILGNAQLVSLMGAQGGDISKYIHNIEKGITQATNLTQQLLTFSKGGAPIKSVIDLKPLITDAVNLALSGLDEIAEIDIQDDLWHVNVDRGQIRQVLQNLILNADQAMPNGGVITVSARNVTASEVKDIVSAPHKELVEIRISDQGIGIPLADQSKVFDPYYTTKKRGSGLGLSVVYSIIKKHDGLITLQSQVGEGTTFYIYLPAAARQAESLAKQSGSHFEHHGSILIMDDEELVLEMAADMMRELGYSVDTARHGEEAVAKYKKACKSGAPYDAVIMDLTIPAGMGGKEAVKRLLKVDPDVRAIVSSGYSNDKVLSNYKDYGFVGMAAKPYTLAELSEVLSNVLSGK